MLKLRHGWFVEFAIDHGFHCIDDFRVPGASAQVPRESTLDLFPGRVWVFVQQSPGGHDYAGGAETALDALLFQDGQLNRIQLTVGLQPLDGLNFFSFARHRKRNAREHGLAVDEHGAGATITLVATDLGAGQFQAATDRIAQRFIGRHHYVMLVAVNVELH